MSRFKGKKEIYFLILQFFRNICQNDHKATFPRFFFKKIGIQVSFLSKIERFLWYVRGEFCFWTQGCNDVYRMLMSLNFLIMTTHKSGPYTIEIGLNAFLIRNNIIIQIQRKKIVKNCLRSFLITHSFLRSVGITENDCVSWHQGSWTYLGVSNNLVK